MRSVFAPIWDDVAARLDARHLPRRLPRRTPTQLDAARGLHQPLALLRGQDVPARPARRRGQAAAWRTGSRRACRSSTTISSTSRCRCPSRLKLGNLGEVVRLNENEPGPQDRARTSRRRATASCCCARSMQRLHARRDQRAARSRASRRPTRAGSAARASTTCARRCSTASAQIYDVPRPRRRSAALVDDHLEGRAEPAAADLVAALARTVVPGVPGRPAAAGCGGVMRFFCSAGPTCRWRSRSDSRRSAPVPPAIVHLDATVRISYSPQGLVQRALCRSRRMVQEGPDGRRSPSATTPRSHTLRTKSAPTFFWSPAGTIWFPAICAPGLPGARSAFMPRCCRHCAAARLCRGRSCPARPRPA